MSRPGRPRKAGKRHANGRLAREREVGPTREQATRRQALAGVRGDPSKTSCPLDLLLLHNLVGGDAGRAASWFSYCARAVLGPPLRKNILDNEPRPAEMSDGRCKRLTNEYLAAIQGLGRAERDLLIELLHFQTTPFWLLADIARRPRKSRDAALRGDAAGARQARGAMAGLPLCRPAAGGRDADRRRRRGMSEPRAVVSRAGPGQRIVLTLYPPITPRGRGVADAAGGAAPGAGPDGGGDAAARGAVRATRIHRSLWQPQKCAPAVEFRPSVRRTISTTVGAGTPTIAL